MREHAMGYFNGFLRALEILLVARVWADYVAAGDDDDACFANYCSGPLTIPEDEPLTYFGRERIEYRDISRLLDDFIFKRVAEVAGSRASADLKQGLVANYSFLSVLVDMEIGSNPLGARASWLLDIRGEGIERSAYLATPFRGAYVILAIEYFRS